MLWWMDVQGFSRGQSSAYVFLVHVFLSFGLSGCLRVCVFGMLHLKKQSWRRSSDGPK
jgi:hypothetical protein